MTKNLKWRLSKLPTVEELQYLVTSKIITQAEARAILFNETDESDRDNDSLKEEIKFLRELVAKLSSRQTIVETIREIQRPYYNHGWITPYTIYCGTSGTGASTLTATATSLATSGTANITKALNNLSVANDVKFSDIKTF